MVSAVFPTPPSPNTTSLYRVIFPCDILNQVCLLKGSLCAVQPCGCGTTTSQVWQRGCLLPPQIAGVTSLSGRGHVNRPSVSPKGAVPDQRASPVTAKSGWTKGGSSSREGQMEGSLLAAGRNSYRLVEEWKGS